MAGQERNEHALSVGALPPREKRVTGRMEIDEFRARQEAVMMRSNTRHVSQDGLDTKGLDTRGLCMCVSSHTTEVSLNRAEKHAFQVLKKALENS